MLRCQFLKEKAEFVYLFFCCANLQMEEQSIDAKFGPAPEPGVNQVLILHFLACIVILNVVRPPFVSDGEKTRYMLIIAASAVLTCLVSGGSVHSPL